MPNDDSKRAQELKTIDSLQSRVASLEKDLEERNHALAEARASEAQYRLLAESASAVIWMADFNGVMKWVSRSVEQLSGYTAEEFLKLDPSSYIVPGSLEKVFQIISKQLARKKGSGRDPASAPAVEIEAVKKNGERIWVEIAADFLTNGAGKPIAIHGVSRDITQRKRDLEDLRRSEDRFKRAARMVSDYILEVDLATNEITWYSDIDAFLGYEPGRFPRDLRGSNAQIHRDDRKRVFEALELHVRTGEPFRQEYRVKRKNGDYVLVSCRGETIHGDSGQAVSWLGVNTDITEARRAEKALRESEERYRLLAETSPDAVILSGLDTQIIWANRQALAMFGYQELAEVKGQLGLELIAPEDRETAAAKLAEHLRNHFTHNPQFTMTRRDGSRFPVEVRTATVRDAAGNSTAIITVIRDVTERQQAESKIARASTEWRQTSDAIPDLILLIGTDRRIARVNLATSKFLDLPFTGIVGRPYYRLMYRMDSPPPAAACPFTATLEDGKEHTLEMALRDDGRTYLVSSTPISSEEGGLSGVVLLFRDITLRKQIEEERRRAQKLESIGILAGGIAHDFNNILGALLMNISFARMLTGEDSKAHSRLLDAEKATERARDLTSQLLTFSKGGAPIRESASIAEIIRDSADFVLHGTKVKCGYVLPADLWPATVDKGQISQVINNIVINAAQAMGGSGVINVTAENRTAAAGQIPGLSPGRYVGITIKDTGAGISPEDLPKIFDPFFTTKQTGNGLGLATSYSIVKKHEGVILVDSEVGKGSLFTIYLPAAGEAAPAQRATVQTTPAPAAKAAPCKVLLMDDDEMIRKTISDILGGRGFRVTCAADGEEAVACCRRAAEERSPFDLVILDLTVPGGKGGKWTIEKLREMDPRIRAIVASGYSHDPVLADYTAYGFKGRIAKPFGVDALLEAIAKAMA